MRTLVLFDLGVLALAVLFSALPQATVQAGPAHFVYTNDNECGPNTVSGFIVSSNGALALLSGSPWSTDGVGNCSSFYATNRIRVLRNGDWLFASNQGDGSISAFKGASTGSLQLSVVTAVEGGGADISLLAGGTCLAAGFAGTGNVDSYKISSDGSLTLVSQNQTGGQVDTLASTKKGTTYFLAATLAASQAVAVFTANPSTCALTLKGTIPTSGGNGAGGVAFSADGSIMYVGEFNTANVVVDAFAFPSGVPEPGSPYIYNPPSAGVDSNALAPSKDGKCLFVPNQYSSSVTSIPLINGIPGTSSSVYPAGLSGGTPSGLAMDSTGKGFYVASAGTNDVTTELIGSGCSLTEAPGTPIGTGQSGYLESLTAYP